MSNPKIIRDIVIELLESHEVGSGSSVIVDMVDKHFDNQEIRPSDYGPQLPIIAELIKMGEGTAPLAILPGI